MRKETFMRYQHPVPERFNDQYSYIVLKYNSLPKNYKDSEAATEKIIEFIKELKFILSLIYGTQWSPAYSSFMDVYSLVVFDFIKSHVGSEVFEKYHYQNTGKTFSDLRGRGKNKRNRGTQKRKTTKRHRTTRRR